MSGRKLDGDEPTDDHRQQWEAFQRWRAEQPDQQAPSPTKSETDQAVKFIAVADDTAVVRHPPSA